MNTLTGLLLVVVVAVVAPVQGRSALSQMLDVVGEFQNADLGSANIPKYSESQTKRALANMAKLFETTREVIAEASKPGALQPAGPDAMKQLELMERVIPLSIKIVADLAAKTAEDPMLEPALPDYTGSSGAIGVPQPVPVQVPATRSAPAYASRYVPNYSARVPATRSAPAYASRYVPKYSASVPATRSAPAYASRYVPNYSASVPATRSAPASTSGYVPKYSESQTNKALANMAKLFQTTRQVIEEASKPGALQPAGPDALKQLELMEKVIPLSIKIVADLAAQTDEDPMV